jgi:hypothetical protein
VVQKPLQGIALGGFCFWCAHGANYTVPNQFCQVPILEYSDPKPQQVTTNKKAPKVRKL